MTRDNDFSWDDLAEGRNPARFGDGQGFGGLPRSPAEALEPARAPEPPRGRRNKRKHRSIKPFVNTVTGGMTFALMIMMLIGGTYFFLKFQFNKNGPLPHSTVIVIPKGEGLKGIADRLVREGVLNDRWLFMLGVMRFRAERKLKAGEYELAKHASVRHVLDTLVEGHAILHKVTVPEGWTSYDIVQALLRQPLLTGDITQIPPEGTLLPDTYRFSRGTNRQELIDRMGTSQKRFIETVWKTRSENLPFDTLQQALILASIVEKETSRSDERKRVASVFVNRLRKKMRLQSDPTIIYGITNGRGKLGRGIRRSEINRKTAYNTYQINGLPPTPICNPGRAAIEAVLRPASGDDLFFVADGTGGHAFAATFADHKENVRNWRKIERDIIARRKNSNANSTTPNANETIQANAAPAADGSSDDSVVINIPGLSIALPATSDSNTVSGLGTISVSAPVQANASGSTIPIPTRKPARQ